MTLLAKNARVAVLCGGFSSEREVSLKTGNAVHQALLRLGYENAYVLDVTRNFAKDFGKHVIDLAFICLHGRFGEDGTIQGLLEMAGVPYTGAGILTSAVAMDKALSKILFEHFHVPTPKWLMLTSVDVHSNPVKRVLASLSLPFVVKPVSEGSTVGFSLVTQESDLQAALDLAFRHDHQVLCEEFVSGKELTVGILSGTALPIIEIVPKSGKYDYESKYTKGATDYYCPARLSDAVAQAVSSAALKAFEALKIEAYARVDVMLDGQERPWVLEVNTIPGMTETSLLPKAAKEAGLNFDALVAKIMDQACLKIGVHS